MLATPPFCLLPSRWQPMLLLFPLLLLMVGCQSTPKPSHQHKHAAVAFPGAVEDLHPLTLLYQQHADWHGTPYRLGGASRHGIDCSAFVQITYRDLFGINLPRTTSEQLSAGQRVSRRALQTGDLVFFRRGGHVGIYLENDQFLHASTSQGVKISNMNNQYWSRHYWRAISVR